MLDNKFTNLTKAEALDYCYKHKNEYIKDFDSVSEGIRAFDCLIEILESGTIKPSQLPEYGMDY